MYKKHGRCSRWCFRCCHKKSAYVADTYLEKADELSSGIRENLLSFTGSGHAFLLFDTPQTAAKVSRLFKYWVITRQGYFFFSDIPIVRAMGETTDPDIKSLISNYQ